MKPFIRILLFAILSTSFAYLIGACQPQSPVEPSKTDLLTQTTWRLVSLKINGADQPTAGYSLRFTKTAEGNGNYTVSGQLFTFPASGTWAFNTNASAILLNGGPAQFRVVSLQQDAMTLETTVTNYKNGDVVVQLVFGK